MLGAACGLVFVGGAGCSVVAPQCTGALCEPVAIDVLTWWPNDNANGPGQPLRTAAEKHANVEAVHPVDGNTKVEVTKLIDAAMLDASAENEYDAILANGGRDVLRWTPCGGPGSAERLVRLDERYADEAFRSRFATTALTGVECCPSRSGCASSAIYAVPLGLHRVNHIIYSRERIAGCPLESVKDEATFLDWLECLRRDERRVISMPVPQQCDFVCSERPNECSKCRDVAGLSLQYLLENLVLLIAGADQYQRYWRGDTWSSASARGEARDLPLRAALDVLANDVRPYVNGCGVGARCADGPTDTRSALEEVGTGRAAFMVMPDWAMLEAVATGGDEVEGAAFPGTEATFLFATDVFAVPTNANVEAGLRWVNTLLERDVQEAFARQKWARRAIDTVDEPGDVASLEALLPSSVDVMTLRAGLHDWILDDFDGEAPLLDFMDQQFAQAQSQGTLRAGPCSTRPCGSL